MSRALLTSLCCALAALSARADPPAPDPGVQIGYLNRTWTNLANEATAVEEGPLSVRLRSPENRVTVHRNRLVLEPREGGDPDARIEAEFEAEGQIFADVEGGRFATTFEDRVTVPRQSVRVAGRARVTRDAEAYHVTLVDGPESTSVEVQSRAIDRVLRLCKEIDRVASLECGRLRGSLSTVHVPLGKAERTLRLPSERLAPEERAYLDRFVVP